MKVAGEAVNKPTAKVVRNRSKFPSMSYHMYNTERFGEYNVNYVFDGLSGDEVPVSSGGRVLSYTLKSPMMQAISRKKDYFMVPMMAILPNNWDNWYNNPTLGDDVPDDAGTGVATFWKHVCAICSTMRNSVVTILKSSSYDNSDKLTALFRYLVFCEYFFSNGSLIASLNCKGSRFLRINLSTGVHTYANFDQIFDRIIDQIIAMINLENFNFTDGDGKIRYVHIKGDTQYFVNYSTVSLRGFLQYMRDDLTTHLTPSNIVDGLTLNFNSILALLGDTAQGDYWTWDWSTNADSPYDLRRVAAYQIVCSHFYSNDHIDYIYSADLYRQLMGYCVYGVDSSTLKLQQFTWNGISRTYDWLSAHYFDYMLGVTIPSNFLADESLGMSAVLTSVAAGNYKPSFAWLGYFSNLFSYRRSLRFVDYFTGSRTRPLAVGDVNVDVNSGSPNFVNVVDVTRNIQRQRFFNAVNRFGRKAEEYIKGLFGVSMAPDYHNPFYLGHTNDVVYGNEVENTGAGQLSMGNSVTSRLQNNGARYQFNFSTDRSCVIIGLSYYDIPRAYLYSCERTLMHLNRFDEFNPFMQFIGDQAVFNDELGSFRNVVSGLTFGYQLRHMEYKQRFDQAAGAFVDWYLPGYIFTNRDDSQRNGGMLDTDFIRSLNTELDDYYVSLTGFSLGHYFHFIVDNDNRTSPSREMAYAPSIL